MNDTPPHVERRVHARNLLREIRTRAVVLSDLEIMALINMLQGVLSERAKYDLPESGGTSPACQPDIPACVRCQHSAVAHGFGSYCADCRVAGLDSQDGCPAYLNA